MKKLSVVICVLICSICAFAQIETPKWQTYVSPKDEFSVEIPKDFAVDFRTMDDADKNKIFIAARYSTDYRNTYYYVFSQVIDQENNKPNEIPVNELKGFISKNSTKVQSEKIGKYSGEQFTFKDSEEFFHKIIFFQTEKRFYIFHTFSNEEANTDSTRFFSSIKFREIEDSPLAKPRAVIKLRNSESSLIVGAGSGQGSGQGSGGGSAKASNGINSDTPVSIPAPSPNHTSPLKIISKPRANYTDLARLYNISGTVTLRVIFLANGTIGAVSMISKLPFGLTNNAISAVRQIRFEPAVNDGAAYNVAKIVQYSFILY